MPHRACCAVALCPTSAYLTRESLSSEYLPTTRTEVLASYALTLSAGGWYATTDAEFLQPQRYVEVSYTGTRQTTEPSLDLVDVSFDRVSRDPQLECRRLRIASSIEVSPQRLAQGGAAVLRLTERRQPDMNQRTRHRLISKQFGLKSDVGISCDPLWLPYRNSARRLSLAVRKAPALHALCWLSDRELHTAGQHRGRKPYYLCSRYHSSAAHPRPHSLLATAYGQELAANARRQ